MFIGLFVRCFILDSKVYLGRSGMLERSATVHEVARSETRGRILDEIEGGGDDLTSDYSSPTHNDNAEDETPTPPASKATTRFRTPQQFARYTAQYGHRHLRGV